MQLYLAAEAAELPETDGRLKIACVDYDFAAPFPQGLPPRREGVMLLGGDLTARRAGEIAEECARRELTAVLTGFGHSPALETLRLCDALLRRGLTPILAERAWQAGAGAEMLISTAVTAGTLRQRLTEARDRCGALSLDLERLRCSYPLPGPAGEGAPLGREALASLLRRGAQPSFSEELMCKVFIAEMGGEKRFILFDDRETLCRKLALAENLGIRRGFLLYPEWSVEEASAAAGEAQ